MTLGSFFSGARTMLLAPLLLFVFVPVAVAQQVTVRSQQTLPAGWRWARDIRWASKTSVFLAMGKSGVYELNLEGAVAPRRVMGNSPSEGFFLTSRLAVDQGKMVAGASWIGGVVKTLGSSGVQAYNFADTIDLDARAGHVVFLGANRDAQNRWAPEGAIVWIGTLSDRIGDLRPVMYSSSPGVKSVAYCGNLDLGAVRFISDDRFVVVPGVEPGVFVYGIDGKLKKAWQTTQLGFYDRCTITSEDQLAYVNSEAGHTEWVAKHVVLDEVIPLPGAVGLITRAVRSGRTEWTLTLLPLQGGETKTLALPFTSSSRYTHVRADTRDNRIAFLLLEYGPHSGPPQQPPKVILTEYVP